MSLTRRDFLRYSGMTAAGAVLGACSTPPTGGETGAGGGAGQAGGAGAAGAGGGGGGGGGITFWAQQPYGDPAQWQALLNELAGEYQEESGAQVGVELINWEGAQRSWLLVTQGGTAPHAADMFWLYSYAQLGGDQYGPRPITEYREEYFPDLEERFIESALVDVFWQDEFYGIPWRVDSRPQLYRVDLLEAAGFSEPPDTWEEITEYAIALTNRDQGVYGFDFGAAETQKMLPWYWQAGGEYMTEDGSQPTVDTPEMRETLTWMKELVHTHQVVPPDFMEQGYDPESLFVSGQLAMVGSFDDAGAFTLARDFPQLEGQWALAIPPMGPDSRDSYSGGGYFGVLHGHDQVEESVQWIAFLARDENMQRLSEAAGSPSPNRAVTESEFWSDTEWKRVLTETLEYSHTSQQPTPAWSAMASPGPGAVMYDLYYDAVVLQQPVDDVLERTTQRMQELMTAPPEEVL